MALKSILLFTENDCIRTLDGTDYIGTKANTYLGASCLPWMREQVEAFIGYVDNRGTPWLSENHCRNYRFDEEITKPWCFTSLVSWQYCQVDFCGK